MTLTLEEVRNTKFHMARRAGYEVTDVDNFVDRVEESFKQLVEENETLKRQVEALQSAQSNAAEQNEFRVPPAAPTPAPEAPPQQAPTPPVSNAVAGQPEKIVVTTAADASPAVVRLVQMATEQAENLVAEAEVEAKERVAEADRRAHEITTDAETRASRVESEARVNAEKMTNDAKNRADDLDRQVGARRRELFAELEEERDTLKGQVASLRDFEGRYRASFVKTLQEQLSGIEGTAFEPTDTPDIIKGDDAAASQDVTAGDGSSSTPRLDALLGDR